MTKKPTWLKNRIDENESYEDFCIRWESLTKEERRSIINQNISKSTMGKNAGHTPWNKGKTGVYTDEQRKNISEGTKKAMNSVPNVGAPKGSTPWNKGQQGVFHLSEEAKQSISEKNKAVEHTEEWNKTIAERLRGRKMPDEQKKKCSDITKALWQDEEYRAKQRASYNGWHGAQSKPEKEIAEWLAQYVDVEQSDRTQIYPFELDIFVPSKNVAIEYNGLYWHSSKVHGPDARNLHLNKTLRCEEKGIRLIHVFADEWENKKEIVKSIILSAIGVYERRIFARKCEVKEVDSNIAVQFIKENHIMETKKHDMLYLGLYYKDELVQLASFRKNFAQRKHDKDIELGRMVTLKNTQVLGGFSKIMKHCPYDKVTSFIDRRLFDGKGYANSGWTVVGTSKPAYFYTDMKVRYNRQKFMKQNCLKMWDDVSEDEREVDMCEKHHLYQIYDCGTIKVEYILNNSK